MILKLFNKLTKAEYQLNVEDKQTSGLFYDFDVVLPSGMTDGEYNYVLIEEENIVATGLCQIGEYVAEATSYNKKEKYKVYNG